MATYKAIKGITVQDLSSDPGTLTQGEVWYNSTSETLKAVRNIGVYAAGGTMLDARENMGSGGPTNAMWLGGGSSPVDNSFDYYNGTSWSANSAIPGVPLYCQSGVGIQDALFVGHGLRATAPTGASSTVMHYNGSWSSDACGNNRRYGAGFGTTAAAMVAGGSTWPNVWNTNSSNTWNGTSWTQEGTLPVGRNLDNASTGIETAGFILGGNPGSLDLTSEWNGTAWSNDGAYPTTVNSSACGGPISAALSVGGNTGSATDLSFQYDGSTWSSYSATLPAARTNMGAASHTAALTDFGIFGGNSAGGVDTTFEMTMANTAQTITTS